MGIMKAEDKDLFEKYSEYYSSYMKHKFIRNYSKEVYSDLIHLYTTYVNPKHNFSHWCSSCRTELVMHLYTWYNGQNTIEEAVVEQPVSIIDNALPIQNKISRKKRRIN